MLANFAFFYVFFTLCICSFRNCTLPSLPDGTITGKMFATRISDWDYINTDDKCEMYEFLLQKTKYRNHHLFVEKENLKNKLKDLENEMHDVKKALSVEEFQCNLLKENLLLKLKEVRQFRIREEKLSNEIELLQSKLSKETLENSVLTERLIQSSSERKPFKGLKQQFCHVISRLKRVVRKRRNLVADKKQDS